MGRPETKYVYRNFIMDSSRWERFAPRDGDVLVCTAYKAGTTWTQMICALLIHQDPDLPKPLAELSPWLDMRLSSIDEVTATYDAQQHRRFIKTHTPLDALPWHENITYLVCGRDPRDVFLSMQDHFANLNIPQAVKLLMEQGQEVIPPPPQSEDVNDRFRDWVTQGSHEWEQDGFPHWSVFRHAQSFWEHRDKPNIHFLHYADLSRDLEGEMRRVAGILGIEIEEARWPALVRAATFGEMKAHADRTAPNTDHGIWNANSDFFRKARSGQWREMISTDNLALYDAAKSARYPAELVAWLEGGVKATGDPKGL